MKLTDKTWKDFVSAFVFVTAIAGMVSAIFSGINYTVLTRISNVTVVPTASMPDTFIQARSLDAIPESAQVIASGSFEGPVVEHSQRVNVVEGWTPFYWPGYPLIGGGTGGLGNQPEYKPLTIQEDPYRVRTGAQSQCWFWFYNIGSGGIWRQEAVPAGLVFVEAFVHAWVSNNDGDPHTSPGEMYVSIGIDTEGRNQGYNHPWDTSVAWSPYVLVRENWTQIISRAVYMEQPGTITIYLRAWKKWADKHGDVYWDDWTVYSMNQGAPLPTSTPAPTYTPFPTYTPYPTYTPQPTPACTPGPISDFGCEYLFDEFSGTSLLRCRDGDTVVYKDTNTGRYACPK